MQLVGVSSIPSNHSQARIAPTGGRRKSSIPSLQLMAAVIGLSFARTNEESLGKQKNEPILLPYCEGCKGGVKELFLSRPFFSALMRNRQEICQGLSITCWSFSSILFTSQDKKWGCQISPPFQPLLISFLTKRKKLTNSGQLLRLIKSILLYWFR